MAFTKRATFPKCRCRPIVAVHLDTGRNIEVKGLYDRNESRSRKNLSSISLPRSRRAVNLRLRRYLDTRRNVDYRVRDGIEIRSKGGIYHLSVSFLISRLNRKGRSTVKLGSNQVAEDPVVMESYNNKALERDHNVDSQL